MGAAQEGAPHDRAHLQERVRVRIPLPQPPSPGGETLKADLHPPRQAGAPVVIMGHGLGAERRFGLDSIARTFHEAGYAVLVPDDRGCGGSDGEPHFQCSALGDQEPEGTGGVEVFPRQAGQ